MDIKKLVIILSIMCFGTGCTQVKHIVTDVKETVVSEKKNGQKAPKAKTTPHPAKKGTTKTTEPPDEDVFGPK